MRHRVHTGCFDVYQLITNSFDYLPTAATNYHVHVAFRWWRGESADVAPACRLVYSHPIRDEPHMGSISKPHTSVGRHGELQVSSCACAHHARITVHTARTGGARREARGARGLTDWTGRLVLPGRSAGRVKTESQTDGKAPDGVNDTQTDLTG